MNRSARRGRVASVVAVTLLAAIQNLSAYGAQPAAAPAPQPPIVQAHRGGSPANSLTGLHASIELGVGELEVDVRITSDGVLVLHHDATTGTSCNRTGVAIAKSSWSDLSDIRCSGEPIPTLDSALSLVRPAAQSLMLDIKRAPGQSDTSLGALTRLVVTAVQRYGLVERTRLSSAEWTVVAPAARDVHPGIRVAAGEVRPSLKRVKLAASLGITEYSIPSSQADLYLVRFPARYGMGVTLWGVDSDARIRYAVDAGSRYLTTDQPAQMLSLLDASTVAELLQNRRVTTTNRSAKTVLSATLKPNRRKYPVVLGTALPTASRERLVDMRLKVVVSGGDKLGDLRIGGPNMDGADDVVLKMPKGSKTFTIRQSLGDNKQLRVYTTKETAKVTVQVIGWRTLNF